MRIVSLMMKQLKYVMKYANTHATKTTKNAGQFAIVNQMVMSQGQLLIFALNLKNSRKVMILSLNHQNRRNLIATKYANTQLMDFQFVNVGVQMAVIYLSKTL